MGRKRAESPSNLKFQQPDRSGPKEKTLLELAEERGLFEQARKKQEENDKAKNPPKIKKIPIKKPEKTKSKKDDDDDDEPLSPGAERFLDTTLYTVSLAMLHFTLDVFVQNQYSADRIVWPKVWTRAISALLGMSIRAHPPTISPTDVFLPSLRLPRLHSPRPLLEPDHPSWPSCPLPKPPPTGHLLCHERVLGMLPDPHHKHVRIPGRHEASATRGLLVGVVRH